MKSSLLNNHSRKNRGDKIFYWCCLAWPIFQFLIFYIYVNFDSFILAFQTFDVDQKSYVIDDPFTNFARFFRAFSKQNLGNGILYNFLNYAIGVGIATPLVIFMSFALYKKIPGNKFYRIMLYAPTIIATTVWVIIFEQTVEVLLPRLIESMFGLELYDVGGLLSESKTQLAALLYFQRWFSLGGGTLLYVATMSGIAEEQVDAMRIDGANMFMEFFHLTMPSVWPIISLYLWTGVPAIITSDLSQYTFFKNQTPQYQSFGYWLTKLKFDASQGYTDLPYVAAIGLLQSAIVLPLMFAVKKLLSKIGPSTEA